MNNIKTFEKFNDIADQNIFDYIRHNDLDSIKNYIKVGSDLNITNINGFTPLIYASFLGRFDVIKLLLNENVFLDKTNANGMTALSITSEYREHYNIVKLLLEFGANPNIKDIHDNTALIHACCGFNNLNNIKLLLDNNADINLQNDKGRTALIESSIRFSIENIEILLDYGADEYILDNDGESFFDKLFYSEKEYFFNNYPTSVYNAISHKYKKSFSHFIKNFKDYDIYEI